MSLRGRDAAGAGVQIGRKVHTAHRRKSRPLPRLVHSTAVQPEHAPRRAPVRTSREAVSPPPVSLGYPDASLSPATARPVSSSGTALGGQRAGGDRAGSFDSGTQRPAFPRSGSVGSNPGRSTTGRGHRPSRSTPKHGSEHKQTTDSPRAPTALRLPEKWTPLKILAILTAERGVTTPCFGEKAQGDRQVLSLGLRCPWAAPCFVEDFAPAVT